MSRHAVSIYLSQKISVSKDYLSYCVLGPIPGTTDSTTDKANRVPVSTLALAKW